MVEKMFTFCALDTGYTLCFSASDVLVPQTFVQRVFMTKTRDPTEKYLANSTKVRGAIVGTSVAKTQLFAYNHRVFYRPSFTADNTPLPIKLYVHSPHGEVRRTAQTNL